MGFGVSCAIGFRALRCIQGKADVFAAVTKRPFCDRRFVHVVPNPRNPNICQSFVQFAPPLAHLRPQEVGKHRFVRPNVAVEKLSVGGTDEIVILHTAIEYFVICFRFVLDTGIDNRDNLKTGCFQVCDQFRGIGETLGAPSENAVAAHIVDVEVDDIAGNRPIAKFLSQLAHNVLGFVAPAALVVSERPFWRKRHPAG